jgi:hypothetical protein
MMADGSIMGKVTGMEYTIDQMPVALQAWRSN